jgi:hypothetical protein
MLTDKQKKRMNRGVNVFARDNLGAHMQAASGIVDSLSGIVDNLSGIVDNLSGIETVIHTVAADDIDNGVVTLTVGKAWTNVLAVNVLSSTGAPRTITGVAHAAAGDKKLKLTITSVAAGDVITAIIV